MTVSIMEPPVRNGRFRQQLAAAVERADTGGSEHLVPGEGGEVDAQGVEVDRLVGHRLAGVQDGQRPDRLGAATISPAGAPVPVTFECPVKVRSLTRSSGAPSPGRSVRRR